MSIWNALQCELDQFNADITDALSELCITDATKNLAIDHACVRFKDAKYINALLQDLQGLGQNIASEEVGGRLVIIFELDTPINILDQTVSALEIPYPKQNHTYEDGWQHIEFVLPCEENTMECPRETFFRTFANLDQKTLEEKYSYAESSPSGSSDALPNPTIELVASNGIEIKFHPNPMQKVVGYLE